MNLKQRCLEALRRERPKARKLKAVWSVEADQNLQAMYHVRAEQVVLDAIMQVRAHQFINTFPAQEPLTFHIVKSRTR